MGATTTISVFHHDRYRSCVVPAVRRLLRSGELGPWLQAVWDHRQSRYPATVGRPFSFEPNGHAEIQLGSDLLPVFGAAIEWFYLPDKQTMERANLIDLFGYIVEGCCLGASAPITDYHWTDFIDHEDDDFTWAVDLHSLLWRLTSGAEIWCDGSGAAVEGIRGWLPPTATEGLARELHRIELPSQPLDAAQRTTNPPAYYRHLFGHRLFHLREIADRAWGMGHGVLCRSSPDSPDRPGFDDPHPAYSTETVQLLARAIRDRREFDVLPVLADALQEAGCENEVVLSHCRDVNEHTDACWVADLILATEPRA